LRGGAGARTVPVFIRYTARSGARGGQGYGEPRGQLAEKQIALPSIDPRLCAMSAFRGFYPPERCHAILGVAEPHQIVRLSGTALSARQAPQKSLSDDDSTNIGVSVSGTHLGFDLRPPRSPERPRVFGGQRAVALPKYAGAQMRFSAWRFDSPDQRYAVRKPALAHRGARNRLAR
jgi:hypothetical protein